MRPQEEVNYKTGIERFWCMVSYPLSAHGTCPPFCVQGLDDGTAARHTHLRKSSAFSSEYIAISNIYILQVTTQSCHMVVQFADTLVGSPL